MMDIDELVGLAEYHAHKAQLMIEIGSPDTAQQHYKTAQALRELQSLRHDYNKALSYVRFYNVPESRAKSLPQAVDVLVSRLQKEISLSHHEAESLREENERLRQHRSLAIRLAAALWEYGRICPECGDLRDGHMPGCKETYEELAEPSDAERIYSKAFIAGGCDD